MIGDKIRERRLEIGLTQSQLSKLTNIKSTTISNYENNISSPSDENIYKLMEVLKCDANYLFEWEEVKDISLSFSEKSHIKKYRQLDNFGKKAVDDLLNNEYDRCISISENEDSKPEIGLTYSKIYADEGGVTVRETPAGLPKISDFFDD